MELRAIARNVHVRVAALVCVCFLLGSTGWISWLYCIMDFADPVSTDLYTMVLGYLSQALGICAFMAAAARVGGKALKVCVGASLAAYVVLLDPATTVSSPGVVLGCGWAMNLCCGFAQGFYLQCLAACVRHGRRGVVLGAGYAVSTFATWVLSSIAGGALSTGAPCLVVCAVVAIVSAALVAVVPFGAEAPGGSNEALGAGASGQARMPGRTLLVLAGATVVVVSLVKNAGFSFPAADLSGVVDLELSRLFYGLGLVVAGIIADRSRVSVLALCAASLAVPFFMLALAGAGASGVALWAAGYLLFGFFTVFRVLLFADLGASARLPWLAGAGLALGRLGDAAGTGACLALGGDAIALVTACALIFAVAAALMLALYRRLYAPVAPAGTAAAEPSRDRLGEFCVEYGLSAREREVLPLLVEGKTNAEIAAALFVTESTAKYHVRNIREKTGCSTRLEVANLFIRQG